MPTVNATYLDSRGESHNVTFDTDEVAQRAGRPGYNATHKDGRVEFIERADIADIRPAPSEDDDNGEE